MTKRSAIVTFTFFSVALSLMLGLFFYGEGGSLWSGLSGEESTILWQLRFPKIIVALLAGGLLASAGLLLQVFFQNPLAGPDLLGINAGACLGVAIAIMGSAFLPVALVGISQPVMAMTGALGVFLLLSFLIRKNLSTISLLVMGLLIASFTSSFISILVNMTPSLQVKNFLMWSMGSFQGVTLERLPLFSTLSLVALVFLCLLPKKLNQLMVGENYAKSMGMNVKSLKMEIILICSYLIGVVTVFCGPIGFIGIIAPHIARSFLKKSDIRVVLPSAFMVGGILALFTELIMVFTSGYSLAANSILGLIGAPLIAFYFYKSRRIS